MLFVFLLSSCDSILKEQIFQRTTYIETDNDAESALASVYSRMITYEGLGQDYMFLVEGAGVGTSDAQDRAGKNMPDGMIHSKAITSTNGIIMEIWENHYTTIAYANNVLYGLDNAPAAVSSAVKTRVYGETLFLRSLHYFNLVRLFGGIPLYLKPTNLINEIPVRQPISVIYKQIISDLKNAADMLPSARSTNGRATKGSAYALLAKVYLTAASMNKYGTKPLNYTYPIIGDHGDLTKYDFVSDSKLYYDSVCIYCQKVTDLQQFGLVPDFMQQYCMMVSQSGKVSDTGFKFSIESLFEVNFTHDQKLGCMTPDYFAPAGSGYSGQDWGGTRCTKFIYDDFYNTHHDNTSVDYRIDVTYLGGTTGIIRKYFKGSPIVLPNGTIDSLITYPNAKAASTEKWPYLAKYQDINAPDYNRNATNFIYLRYADVLLMQAEAENEINGPSNAYQYVNLLMTRARNANGTPRSAPTDFANMTQDQFREAIWKERNFELMGEAHMWYDLVRTGKYITYIDGFNAYEFDNPDNHFPGEVKMISNPNNVLFPIPLSEITINSKIIQNQGF